MRVIYGPPNGPKVKNPTKVFIRDLIFREGEAYWQCNAGAGSIIAIDENGEENDLSITLFEPHGFFVTFLHEPSPGIVYAAVSSRDFDRRVTVYDHAGERTIPLSAFIAKD
jgi:hypothetical protein